ncbi:hypothetical protein FWF89_00585 [Candidatus Saccharibacteria bacterium]|nr:hypothetical protein [Candidatus Saccharibacteria bacterium]
MNMRIEGRQPVIKPVEPVHRGENNPRRNPDKERQEDIIREAERRSQIEIGRATINTVKSETGRHIDIKI